MIQVTSTSAEQLSNGLGDLFVGRTNQDGQGPATMSIHRGLIEFDIAGSTIPSGATITGVTLTLNDVKGMNGNEMVTLYQMYRDWGQGTSFFNGGQGTQATNGDVTWYYTFYNASDPSASPTWTTPGGEPGVDFSASASARSLVSAGSPNQFFTWSSATNPLMLNDVQQWLDNPATDFGWILFGNESAGQTAHRFGGQYASSPVTPPQLTVQYASTWIWSGSAGTIAWTALGNWTAGAGFPPGGAAIVLGGSQAAGGRVDLLSAAPSVSHLAFDASEAVTVTSTSPGGGLLTLDNGGFPAALTISGSGHTIDKPVTIALNSDAWITTSGSSDSLAISGDIDDGTVSHAIVKDGLGTLILSGSDGYTGGTSVMAGTLIVESSAALLEGSSLIIGVGASPFGFSTAAAPVDGRQSASASPGDTSLAVPEPATLLLLLAGGFLAVFVTRRRRMR